MTHKIDKPTADLLIGIEMVLKSKFTGFVLVAIDGDKSYRNYSSEVLAIGMATQVTSLAMGNGDDPELIALMDNVYSRLKDRFAASMILAIDGDKGYRRCTSPIIAIGMASLVVADINSKWIHMNREED